MQCLTVNQPLPARFSKDGNRVLCGVRDCQGRLGNIERSTWQGITKLLLRLPLNFDKREDMQGIPVRAVTKRKPFRQEMGRIVVVQEPAAPEARRRQRAEIRANREKTTAPPKPLALSDLPVFIVCPQCGRKNILRTLGQ